MKQSSALILAAVVTAFVLVVIGGVTATLMQPAPAQTAPTTQGAPTAQPAPAEQPPPTQLAPADATTITADRAALLALDATEGAQLSGTPELVNFEGTTAYEVVLDQGNVYVDAQSGDILHNGAAPAVPASVPIGPISREQAIQAATDYVGGGTVREAELEREDGMQVYEVEFINGSEVYVDAQSGQVVYAELSSRPARGNEREEYEEREHDDYEEYEEYEEHDDD